MPTGPINAVRKTAALNGKRSKGAVTRTFDASCKAGLDHAALWVIEQAASGQPGLAWSVCGEPVQQVSGKCRQLSRVTKQGFVEPAMSFANRKTHGVAVRQSSRASGSRHRRLFSLCRPRRPPLAPARVRPGVAGNAFASILALHARAIGAVVCRNHLPSCACRAASFSATFSTSRCLNSFRRS